MREFFSSSPFFPKYGRFVQITFLSSLLLLILSFLLTFDFSLLIIEFHTYFSYVFHDINILLWSICCWKACLLLQNSLIYASKYSRIVSPFCLIFSDIKMLFFGLLFILYVWQLSGRNSFRTCIYHLLFYVFSFVICSYNSTKYTDC